MNSLLTVLCLLLQPLQVSDGGRIEWVPGTVDQADGQAAARRGRPSMVYFTADWSQGCRRLDRGAFSDPLVVALSKRFICRRVDLTDPADFERAKATYGLTGVPTVRFCDQNGEKVDELIASYSAEALIQRLGAEGKTWKDPAIYVDANRWQDTHRVYLRNGNMLDGLLKEVTDVSVVLQWNPQTAVCIDRGDVVRVESLAIRSSKARPAVLLPERAAPSSAPDTPENSRVGRPRGSLPVSRPGSVEDRVNRLIAKLGMPGPIDPAVEELSMVGPEGLVYAVTLLNQLELKTALAVTSAITCARELATSEPLRQKLDVIREPELLASMIGALQALEAGGAVQALQGYLGHRDARVRAASAAALGSLGDRFSVRRVCDAVLDPDPAVRERACTAVVALAARIEARDEIWSYLSERAGWAQEAWRDQAALVFGRLKFQEAVPALTEWLGSREVGLRGNAVRALADLDAKEAGNALVEMLKDESEARVVRLLCFAIAKIRVTQSVPVLIEVLLRTSDAGLRRDIGRALETLTLQRFGADENLWQEWYEKSKSESPRPPG